MQEIKEFLDEIKGDRFFHPKLSLKVINDSDKDIYRFISAGNKIIGMWMLRGWDEGYDIPSFGMIVLQKYRGLGLGKSMLKTAIKKCRELKCEKMRLTVDDDNTIAKNMYINSGFIFKGKIGIKKL